MKTTTIRLFGNRQPATPPPLPAQPFHAQPEPQGATVPQPADPMELTLCDEDGNPLADIDLPDVGPFTLDDDGAFTLDEDDLIAMEQSVFGRDVDALTLDDSEPVDDGRWGDYPQPATEPVQEYCTPDPYVVDFD